MARPHIESIQAQLMPWVPFGSDHPRAGAEARVLSEDDENGACSLMIRYPAGWSRKGTEVLTANEEFFVLDGEIELAGETYGLHDYAMLPAGHPSDDIAAPKGAVVLTFFSEAPSSSPAADHKGGFDEELLIKKVSTISLRWDRSQPQREETNAGDEMEYYEGGLKFLRQDPHTKDQSFLFSASPQTHPPGWSALQETHPTVEESFVVMGEMIGPREVRSAGAYFWRPPHILHGPFGSLTGVVSFVRTQGGALLDIWNEPKMGYSFNPESRPQVPANLQEYATDKWTRQTCF
jgi:hypothetical protein